MRCPRCGNENPDINRFCGMCGASLISAAPAGGAPPKDARASSTGAQADRTASTTSSVTPNRRPASAVASAALPARQHSSPQREKSEPGITVPSFLGLNTPPSHNDAPREDPVLDQLRSSRNLDYLLEDDEEEPKRGWGKVLLILVALGLALGFGYLHWKQGGFDWITGSEKKPRVSSPDTSSPSGSASNLPPASTSTSAQPPSTSGSDANQTATPQAPASGTPSSAASNPTPGPTAPASTAQANPSQSAPSTSAENVLSDTANTHEAKSDTQLQKSAERNKSEPSNSASARQPVAEASAPKARPAKPSAALPVSTVAEAERYIYGRGVRQDCDHGLRLLKRAAEADPKAMTAMGTLYSTGTCTPRDLPTAYRWYASALHKDPDNQALQNDLQKLWSQMTQPERQLAIRLSQ